MNNHKRDDITRILINSGFILNSSSTVIRTAVTPSLIDCPAASADTHVWSKPPKPQRHTPGVL